MQIRNKLFRKFRRAEDGAATVEAVLWLPFFVLTFVLIADLSFVFRRQAEIQRIVQDANRLYSVGFLQSESEAETWVKDAIATLSTSAIVDAVEDGGVIRTQVLVPVDDLVAVGGFDFLSGYRISVQTEQMIEFF
jgi:Flp pilus assembly protein TadG